MWHLGTWLSVGLGRAGLMVEMDDLKGLFCFPRAKLFCDSVTATTGQYSASVPGTSRRVTKLGVL